jgi:hypothetical protein
MMDRRGQSALFDAMAFLVIMLVASTVVFAYAGALRRDAETSTTAGEMAHTQEMLVALLRCTVANASYTDGAEPVVHSGEASVEILLLEELALVGGGLSNESFGAGYNGRIATIAASLAEGRTWTLVCSGPGSVSFSVGPELPEERSAASVQAAMGDGARAGITLYTWRE